MTRPRIVWLALLAATTSVAGLLMALDGKPTPRLDGLALSAPLDATTPTGIETIFKTRSELDRANWDGIVIHHSSSPHGSFAQLASDHEQRGLAGLGHHFVIGNGSGAGDGEIHVGYRWLDQLPGAHTGGPNVDSYNRRSIGICLIGDGDRRDFSDLQLRRLIQLVSALQAEFAIPNERVRLGRDIASTTSPGRYFPETAFRGRLAEFASAF